MISRQRKRQGSASGFKFCILKVYYFEKRLSFMIAISNFILIGFGGFLGSICRVLTTQFFGNIIKTFPVIGKTAFVNLTGCFLIGFFSKKFAPESYQSSFFILGFLGSYTTFSSFAFENINFLQDKLSFLLLVNICAQIILGLIFVKLGLKLG